MLNSQAARHQGYLLPDKMNTILRPVTDEKYYGIEKVAED
jgi:hypothetical protein